MISSGQSLLTNHLQIMIVIFKKYFANKNVIICAKYPLSLVLIFGNPLEVLVIIVNFVCTLSGKIYVEIKLSTYGSQQKLRNFIFCYCDNIFN